MYHEEDLSMRVKWFGEVSPCSTLVEEEEDGRVVGLGKEEVARGGGQAC
jgi:hypothetical protein